MVDDTVGHEVLFAGEDTAEHVRYPGGVQDDQVLEGQVGPVRVAPEVEDYSQIVHELQRSWDILVHNSAL